MAGRDLGSSRLVHYSPASLQRQVRQSAAECRPPLTYGVRCASIGFLKHEC